MWSYLSKRLAVGMMRLKPGFCHQILVCPASSSAVSMIDLRSDVLTKPTAEIKTAMMAGTADDDVFNEDKTVFELQKEMAEHFGTEAALYVPSGTMGNLISVLSHCHTRGLEVILGNDCHLVCYEQGGIASIGGVHPRMISTLPDGTLDLLELESCIRPHDDPHQPRTGLVCLENTHNNTGGKVIPLDYMKKLKEKADHHKIPVHLDGARMMNAAVALDVSLQEMMQHVDSVSFCFSKGVGAPIGSIIGGTAEFVERGLRLRKVLGGGWRKPGMLASAARYCMLGARERIQQDHKHAQILATAISVCGSDVVSVDVNGVHSNMVFVKLIKKGLSVKQFLERLAEVTEDEKRNLNDSIVLHGGPTLVPGELRFALYSSISPEDVEKAVAKVQYVLKEYSLSE